MIATVDKELVFRFPRDKVAYNRQLYEAKLFKLLKDKITLPIPEILEEHISPEYLVTKYLSGAHVSPSNLRLFPQSYVELFSLQIAQFIYELNQAISPETVLKLRIDNGLIGQSDEPWSDTFSRVLEHAEYSEKPWLEDLAHKQYDHWYNIISKSKLPTISVHDDLHLGNLLFQDNQVSAILDFGDAATGSAAQEMRQLLYVGNEMLNSAIREYKRLTGIEVDEEEVTAWTFTTELASYCERLNKKEFSHPTYIRTKDNLRHWFPDYTENF